MLWPPDVKSQVTEKRPWCWERLRAGGEGGNRGWDGWMASSTQWTWIWANSRRWWKGQRSLVCCSPWGRKELDMTEQEQHQLQLMGGHTHQSLHTQEHHSSWKGMKPWHSVPHGWTPRTWCSVTEAERQTHRVWFHWWETSRTGRSTDTESGFLVVRGYGGGEDDCLLGIRCFKGVMTMIWN